MASSVIGALRVNLGLDSAKFTRGATQAQKSLNNMRRQFLAVTGVVTAMGAALTAVAIRGANDIDRLVKGGRRIDGTANALQALELAASEAGVSISGLTNDVQTMNRELAAGSAGAQRALQRLSLSAADLSAMDADERLATIADRVKELGLSAGEATGILRDLGIRKREMALLMLQGGDAIRSARNDIRDYGLEIDDALGAKIEQANDRIARLGVVTQLFGQRLAAEIVPTLGAFAQIITDSMREGGLLRGVIEALTSNMSALVSIAGVAVVAFGTRYVAALVAAKLATFTLTGALVALRTALLRTGIGALIVGAGFLVDWLVKLRLETGSWGDALEALGRVAHGVWEGISTSARAMVPAMQAVFEDIKAGFFGMLEALSSRWAKFLTGISQSAFALGWDEMAAKIGGAAESAWQSFDGFSESARNAAGAADSLRSVASQMASEGFDTARAALADLNTIINRNTVDTDAAADAARGLANELEALAGGGGGGGGASTGGAGGSLLQQAKNEFDQLGQSIQSSMEQGFMSIFDGTRKAADAFKNMAQQILSELFRVLVVQRLVGAFGVGGGAGTGILGAIQGAFGGFRADGGPVSAGRSYIVGERGPELFTPGASGQITSNEAMRSGDVVQNFSFNLSANGDESVKSIVAQAAPQIVEAAKSAVLDARRRGGSYRAAFG